MAKTASQPPPTGGRWLSANGAADYAAVNVRTIRRWIAGGLLPVGRVGKVVRIWSGDLDQLLRGK